MRPAMRVIAGLVAATTVVMVAGCGDDNNGQPSSSGSISSSDRLNVDGSYSDLVPFTASRTGTIIVSMTSSGSDPVDDPFVLVLLDAGGEPGDLIAFNDDSGGGLNAAAAFNATAGERYWAQFTTFMPNDFGTYSYSIVEVAGSTRQEQDSAPNKPGDVDKSLSVE